jgi:hypothetical protein
LLNRRTFSGVLGAGYAELLLAAPNRLAGPVVADRVGSTKRVAFITTVLTTRSQAQHITDRFLVGYPRDGRWHQPAVQVVSLYVDQTPAGDLSALRAARHGFTIYPTISAALRCGGDRLAVDGVVIIGEQGDYPRNQKGQVLYPRHDFFQQLLRVFEQDRRAVPVFNGGALSHSWRQAEKMVAAANRLKFPLLAGSSLPVTWRLPPIETPYGAVLTEALMVGSGNAFRALEALQCMVERRKGGETGIKSVQMIEGDAVWEAGKKGRWSKRLLEAALSRSDSHQGVSTLEGRPQDLANNNQLPELVAEPVAYLIERNDGLRTVLLLLDGAIEDVNMAVQLAGGEILSTQFLMPNIPNVTQSARLADKIEQMMITGSLPYPVERAQIAGAILDRCLDSKLAGHLPLQTPEMNICYRVPSQSGLGD